MAENAQGHRSPAWGEAHGHETSVRKPHAVLDLESRRLKALKIERLLDLESRPQPMRMLEVGTGSGGIAHYFGTHATLHFTVDAVDVHDNRQVREGYRYQTISDTRLPFPEACFDVVLTNHVIEHVGDEHAQHSHLTELHRVLRPGGIGYLAVPNRWMLVEPHYRLAFLSWLPHAWRTPYLRAMHKGEVYDCEPLQLRQLERMLARAGFSGQNLGVDAMRMTFEIERPDSMVTAALRKVSNRLLTPFSRIIPTLIYRFSRDG
jgi:ubiquinone/menaquinone biosynthesis C-methylase UbiE